MSKADSAMDVTADDFPPTAGGWQALVTGESTGFRDLSQPVGTGMTVYPGDPEVAITAALTLDRDGVAVAQLRLGSHTGTHLDAPAHTVAGGRSTGSIGLDELTGEALVVHLPPLPPRTMFGLPAIDAALTRGLPDRVPAIVVLHTGWSRHFGTAVAIEHPALEEEAATELVRRGMRLLAIDTLSPDLTRPDQTQFPVHGVVLGADRLIVENLTNLDGLPERVFIGFFPLAIDADGAPVRAIAVAGAPDRTGRAPEPRPPEARPSKRSDDPLDQLGQIIDRVAGTMVRRPGPVHRDGQRRRR